jgi:deazaflavin-dependent oxidoreductase (nitroreductase family)
MDLQDGTSVIADLTTIGRKSGQPRTVELRFIYYQGCFYATSSRVAGKHWCQNLIANPSVEINTKGTRRACTATQVRDENLKRRVLTLRGSPPEMTRVVFEIKPEF